MVLILPAATSSPQVRSHLNLQQSLRLVAAVDRPAVRWINVTWVIRTIALAFGLIFLIALIVGVNSAAPPVKIGL